jgi:hypothetical protein
MPSFGKNFGNWINRHRPGRRPTVAPPAEPSTQPAAIVPAPQPAAPAPSGDLVRAPSPPPPEYTPSTASASVPQPMVVYALRLSEGRPRAEVCQNFKGRLTEVTRCPGSTSTLEITVQDTGAQDPQHYLMTNCPPEQYRILLGRPGEPTEQRSAEDREIGGRQNFSLGTNIEYTRDDGLVCELFPDAPTTASGQAYPGARDEKKDGGSPSSATTARGASAGPIGNLPETLEDARVGSYSSVETAQQPPGRTSRPTSSSGQRATPENRGSSSDHPR